MIHTDYKIRPSAKDILDSSTIRNQVIISKKYIYMNFIGLM